MVSYTNLHIYLFENNDSLHTKRLTYQQNSKEKIKTDPLR